MSPNGLLLDPIDGKIKRTRELVRRKTLILDDLKKRSYGDLNVAVEDRDRWRMGVSHRGIDLTQGVATKNLCLLLN